MTTQTRRERFSPLFSKCEFRDPETGKYCADAHWKNPVRVVVEEDKVSEYCEAITFFVGGLCRTTSVGDGQVQITNRGYYNNIGA